MAQSMMRFYLSAGKPRLFAGGHDPPGVLLNGSNKCSFLL